MASTSDHSKSLKNGWLLALKQAPCLKPMLMVMLMLTYQGRIQDLSEGGGQDFLGTKNRAAGKIFF